FFQVKKTTIYLAITATTRRPTTPSTTGCYLGCDDNCWAALDLCGVNAAYVYFYNCWVRYEGSVYVYVLNSTIRLVYSQ
ncbi:MAG: hypothetical protein ACKPKO_17795, partial [Candidatus Fonsibacter sp.]